MIHRVHRAAANCRRHADNRPNLTILTEGSSRVSCWRCRCGTGRHPQLKGRRIAVLRVIDLSIFPRVPSSNANIPSIAVGEKGAQLIMAG